MISLLVLGLEDLSSKLSAHFSWCLTNRWYFLGYELIANSLTNIVWCSSRVEFSATYALKVQTIWENDKNLGTWIQMLLKHVFANLKLVSFDQFGSCKLLHFFKFVIDPLKCHFQNFVTTITSTKLIFLFFRCLQYLTSFVFTLLDRIVWFRQNIKKHRKNLRKHLLNYSIHCEAIKHNMWTRSIKWNVKVILESDLSNGIKFKPLVFKLWSLW